MELDARRTPELACLAPELGDFRHFHLLCGDTVSDARGLSNAALPGAEKHPDTYSPDCGMYVGHIILPLVP